MIVGSNQPYLFPYIGYWQLMNHVDVYVISDNMQYINKGYINRNNILVNEKSHLFTLQALGVKSGTLINEVEVGSNSKKILSTVFHSYKKAPHFEQFFPVVEDVLSNGEKNLARFVGYSMEAIARYLEIDTKFLYLSELQGETTLMAQERTIDICKRVDGKIYVNAIGGKKLYDSERFNGEGIALSFLKPDTVTYRQFGNEFVPNLSIVDVLMFNSKPDAKEALKKFSLE